jgi:hypothetical protein
MRNFDAICQAYVSLQQLFNVSPHLHIFITTKFLIQLFILFGCGIKNKIRGKLGPLPKTVEEAVRVGVPQVFATELCGELFLRHNFLKTDYQGTAAPSSIMLGQNFVYFFVS